MALQTSDSLVVLRALSSPRVRLVCFPHSGGGPSAFSAWPELLEQHGVEVVAVSAPGRERRIGAAPLTDWAALVGEACEALRASGLVDDVPYALLGHSLGALLAYEAARRLDVELAEGRPRPIHLFVSGHGAPSTAPAAVAGASTAAGEPARPGRLHTLDDAALVEAVRAFGFLPAELAADAGLAGVVLPALRADFQVYEGYMPEPGRAPLALPITAFGGREDMAFPPDSLNTWGGETTRGFNGPELFPGGHFFIDTSRAELLGAIRCHLDGALSALPLSVLESRFVVPEVCNTLFMHEVIQEGARKHPNAEAIVDETERVTYHELARRIDLLATRLQRDCLHGKVGEVVALLMPHDATYVMCMLAIWQAAAVLNIIEPHFPAAMCKEICEGSSTTAALVSADHAPKFDDVQNCHVAILEGSWFSTLREHSTSHELLKARIKDTCMLMMTSGTTGRPKTIAGSHYFIHLGHLAKVQEFPYQDDDCREAFNVMFVWEAIRPLLYGLTSFIIADAAVLDPQLFVATLQKHRCSRVLTTPSLLATILQYSSADIGKRLELMRTWFMCGEVLPMKTVHNFRKLLPACRLINDYSTWESGDVSYAVTSPAPAYEPSQVFAVAGQIAAGSIAVIVDTDTRMVVPRGVPGELYIGGAALSSGYYGQPEVTAERFVDGFTMEMQRVWGDKWYKTGDLGRLVGEPPVLEIRGRLDSTVKIRGFKVGLPVVEATVQEVDGVAVCAVVAVYETPAVVDSLLCFIGVEEGLEFDSVVQRVKQEAVQKIPRWMLPAYFRPMPENCTTGGEARKLDRKRLQQLADLKALREGQAAAESAAAEAAAHAVGMPGMALEAGTSAEAGVRSIVRGVWAKALNLNPQSLDLDENFFDLGGHSTLAARIAADLSDGYGLAVTVLDIYAHSSLGALLDLLDAKGAQGREPAKAAAEGRRGPRGRPPNNAEGIAVVGLAGRLPGAVDAAAFWENLLRGTVSATFLSKDFLRGKGVSDEVLGHKDFVPCAYMIADADKFDHHFFGIGRHEASLMDPQHRVFVETAWAAMENAALSPRGGLAGSVVGVFAAAGIDGYLLHHLDGRPLKDTLDPQDIFLAEIGNEKDYIATRVSYLLDFTGPSMNVNSACSSALVAAAQAAASIAAGQCDAAVAGASSVTFPNLGYLYQDGLVSSADGYVRPFDAGADGTVFGDSVASFVLRRREDAHAGLLWASMRGFAISNDGGQKAGYAAPSPVGQSIAIMSAMQMMGEDPWSISYVECHATGTRVGDGIEVRGLISAFNQVGGTRGPNEARVALGSVKGNIAHANCAAGATGLVKTLMMLSHMHIAPTANFKQLNPKVSLAGTPFFLNAEICPWQTGEGQPLRAGVSSFGIGGTNAHTILEAAAAAKSLEGEAEVAPRWPFHLLPFSGKTQSALLRSAERVLGGLRAPCLSAASVTSAAYTLQSGRAALPLRRALVVPAASALDPEGGDLAAAVDAAQRGLPGEEELEELEEALKRPTVAMVFPGQGSQYPGMARDLYEQVPLFRAAMDECCALLGAPESLGFDLRPLLFSSGGGGQDMEREFARPSVLQPSLFAVEYSLAQVLLAVGVVPVAVAGHSLGEYVAAVIGGLLTLEAATRIVAARAKSTETLAGEGAMLSVAEWSEEELAVISKGERPSLWLAAVNSPVHAVISGEVNAIGALEAELKAAGRKCTKLHVEKAFHSGLIAEAADTLKGLGMPGERGVTGVPVASNYTGGWLSAAQLQDGTYWANHMRNAVQWRQNAEKIMAQWQPTVVFEVGPGNALSMLTAKCVSQGNQAPVFVQAMRHPRAERTHDVEALLTALGRLWEVGCAIDWHALHTKVLGVEHAPMQLRLPTYAFDRTSLWVNPNRSVHVDFTPDPVPATYASSSQPEGREATTARAARAPALLRLGEGRSLEPSIRAYCLPFASGSATVFMPWAQHLDDAVEVVAVELPGRGGRADERMPRSDSDDEAMLEALCGAILADLRGVPYVLVGFSMGGGLSVEVALRMVAKGVALPLALYIAGRKPPAADPAAVAEITMTDAELAEYAFAPPEVARSPEFAEHVVPLLRADLELDARAERRLSAASVAGRTLPAGVGFEVFCGTCDKVAPWSAAIGWQRFAQCPIGLHYFPGGHEFMQEHRPMLHSTCRRDAISRLVQKRAAEIAALSAQGLAGPGLTCPSPAAFGASASSGLRPAAAPEDRLPLYAVRWVVAEPTGQEVPSAPTYFLGLAATLSAEMLDSVGFAMRGGATIIVACTPTVGTPAVQGLMLDTEVRQCWQFMLLVQHLLAAGLSGHVIVVCPAAAAGAMVAGASKAVAMEASELRIQRVFVPPACLDDAQERVAAIHAWALRHPRETDIWFQDIALQSRGYSPRLEPMSPPNPKLPCVQRHNADGTLAVYVLTGATGGLGRSVVEWLLRDQALLPEQLVLLRRRGGVPATGELARCCTVEVAQADSREALLSSSLGGLHGVAGLFHLAGALNDGMISGMTQERFQKVASPKCGILIALMHVAAALRWPVQWLIGFSSTSSLFGYAGQSNYCAANAMLDHFAAFGGGGALPDGDTPPCRVLTINWGPWAEAGMAKVGTKAYEQAMAEGDTPLPTATALSCLAAALRLAAQAQPAAVQLCACDVAWHKSQWRDLPILGLVSESAPQQVPPAPPEKVGAASPQKSAEEFLAQHTKSGSSWKRIQGKSLHQLGLDSLEIVQLRNLFNKKFGVNVPLGVLADPSQKLSGLALALSVYFAA